MTPWRRGAGLISCNVQVGSSLESLYKLGAHLSKLSQVSGTLNYSAMHTVECVQHQMKDTMDTLTSHHPHLLLQQGR